ncbi:MAG: diaminopimelate decarboxylase [Deltaproteobacteria bacterium]|jgi:diaminopimelate decarboxylase|nr:diaminopimelate decarboxylase [Deltaproteobacteria bacterium]
MDGGREFFAYRDGRLHAEDLPLEIISREVGTPVYVYSKAAFLHALKSLEDAFKGSRHLICYSVKAASNLSLLALVAERGLGADIVSGGELYRALKAGVSPRRIVYSGVGKTAREMREALEAELFMFNLESEGEMLELARVAEEMDKVAQISFRVNPDVDPHTHPYVATGLKESKFGVSREEARRLYAEARKIPWFKVIGIGCHIGSQLTELAPFRDSLLILADLARELRSQGHNIRYLDMGGGVGIRYRDENPLSLSAYAEMSLKAVSDIPDLTLVVEPGRSVAGNSAVLLTRVLYNKRNGGKRFVVADAAMNDLIRPSLYGSYHAVWPLNERPGAALSPAALVGPVCESGDFLAKDRELPDLAPGDCLAVKSAGAYGFSMSSNYNSRPRAAEVLVSGGDFRVIREREDYESLVSGEDILQLN